MKFTDIIEKAPRPFKVPACLKCCFKGRKRTSFNFFHTVLFGEIRQIGNILKSQFNS